MWKEIAVLALALLSLSFTIAHILPASHRGTSPNCNPQCPCFSTRSAIVYRASKENNFSIDNRSSA
jgi:hypothetical protein